MNFVQAFPDTLQLTTDLVKLRMLVHEDIHSLIPLSQSKIIWQYFTKNLAHEDELNLWVADAMLDKCNEKRFPFVIVQKSNNEICGSTSFGNIFFYDKRIEIGWTWLGEKFIGKGINMHIKFLMLTYAFEKLGMERVEIKTDNLNIRAKRALTKIGATPEGVLRSHMETHDHRRRDSVYYSILKQEWPSIKRSVFRGIVVFGQE